MKVKILFLLFLTMLILTVNLYGQGAAKPDTTSLTTDTVPEKYKNAHPRIPVLAFGLSFVVPIGLGQYYNKQYVKGGIITGMQVGSYIGLASTFKAIGSNSQTSAFFGITLFATYIYSIIDAPISANHLNDIYHLHSKKSFSSLHIYPVLINNGNLYANTTSTTPGFTLILR